MFGLGRVLVGDKRVAGQPACTAFGEGLARALDAVLIPVIAWELPGGDRAHRVGSSRELGQACRDLAGQRLRDALMAVWVRFPTIRGYSRVERGPVGWVLVNLASRPDDVLVVGVAAGASLGGWPFPR